ncbi:YafY family transcriptional regulator [Frankia sp. AgB1.9]|uniref:helix-turn-helix transcriptional regulator n=1 Tax=unclassified Frankia TaxID=2632575 RepID=UPI001931ABDF|nr:MULTISPECIES: YafY family protein [unclassified Frankia]MBL7488770.1 YafY family transcriptional regulator [Frankia sp. AgW1.1]MBL7546549.1 YafY family transcriptional regulator [Frankia sp. AgB1.9]MBL7625081.1 YafY family transcriptional regulator [Frankia sp. AgB1.8]
MARPTARVLALLETLQSGGTHPVAALAARLEVDERTVRRYVDQLRDLDVPVRSVRGRHGGYRLAPGYRLPPLMLTESEALAVLLGLVAGQRAGLVTTADPAAESAAAKLRRVLPEALGRRLAALLETIEFTAPARRTVTTTETDVLLLMAEAARERRPVSISYTASDGRHSARTVYPYGIVAHSGRWYVTGDDSVSGEVRTFRLDRISLPRVLPGSFDVPAGFDPADQVLAGIAGAPRRHEVSLRVRGTADDVRARLPTGVATVGPLDGDEAPGPSTDQWVRVRIRAERLDWIPPLIAGLGRPFVIDQPDELRDLTRSYGRQLAAQASATTSDLGDDCPTGGAG